MRRKALLVTLVIVPLALVAAALIVPCISVDSVPKMREAVLRNDVFQMHVLIAQYTRDLHKRPQSVDDLVTAGYLKRVPIDPLTGRNDTWVAEWSTDASSPGIVGIRSGSSHR
jgi:general secretion pathway protein G